MTSPLLYTAELDLAEADTEAFRQWYANRHAPDVYQCGFLTCTCYRAVVGGMNFLDIYEVPDMTVFHTPRYRGMAGRDPYMADLMAKRLNKTHTVYAQHMIVPDDTGAWLNADWLSIFRFESPASADTAIINALAVELGRLRGLGLARMRFACREHDHPTYPSVRPRCMVVMEWPHQPPADAHLSERLLARFGTRLTHPSVFIGRRLYPWPDQPT